METDKPVRIFAQPGDDHVALILDGVDRSQIEGTGHFYLGLPPATARELAETLLASLGEVTGERFMLVRIGGPRPGGGGGA